MAKWSIENTGHHTCTNSWFLVRPFDLLFPLSLYLHFSIHRHMKKCCPLPWESSCSWWFGVKVSACKNDVLHKMCIIRILYVKRVKHVICTHTHTRKYIERGKQQKNYLYYLNSYDLFHLLKKSKRTREYMKKNESHEE